MSNIKLIKHRPKRQPGNHVNSRWTRQNLRLTGQTTDRHGHAHRSGGKPAAMICRRRFFFFFSGPFSACSIHVGPCARRPNFSRHAREGGCWRGSPANARRQGVRAGRVRARQHYKPPGGNSSRDAAKARCAATAKMPLHLTTHAALAAARRAVGTSAARARASKRMKVAASGPTCRLPRARTQPGGSGVPARAQGKFGVVCGGWPGQQRCRGGHLHWPGAGHPGRGD